MKTENPLDTMLNFACGFDWITPLYAILRDAFHDGPVAHFGVSFGGWFDRGDIRRILSAGGVESWGYLFNVDGDLIMFSVAQEQAALASEVLQREGVPVLYSPAQDTGDITRPTVALSNSFHTGDMRLVKAPGIRDLIKRLAKG